jgi:hypothetical protein
VVKLSVRLFLFGASLARLRSMRKHPHALPLETIIEKRELPIMRTASPLGLNCWRPLTFGDADGRAQRG